MLDAWPLVRYAFEEPEYVGILQKLFGSSTQVIVSSINLGEVYYVVARRKGIAAAERTWTDICNRAQVEAPTLELTREAAKLTIRSRIPWADAHAAATALAHGGVVWAGDTHLNKPDPWKRRDLRHTI